jgi:pyruvate, orthophosphate dikinase
VLVRPFTEADDVHGFFAAEGILTAEGGKASHAALVARGMGKPCVAGASALRIDLETRVLRIGDVELREGDTIAIDGSTGVVTADDVPLTDPEVDPNLETVLGWADSIRRLGVRANADTPEDARRAREFGAEGIGLCRTEHMFMAADRQPKMQAMIMAEDGEHRRAALAELLPLQEHDFEGLFEAMGELPVTIRLLDPPLHEFLPSSEELAVEIERARHERPGDVRRLERTLDRVRSLEETNPMLGTRGARLGLIAPEIYDVQVEAIVNAARAVRDRSGATPDVEIMLPLVAYEQEVAILRARVEHVIESLGAEDVRPAIGTMIELPRACFIADRIAREADFFSFGTNDLTQTALGLSRDDVESGFLTHYLEQRILDRSPFETIDKPGVGWLVRLGAWVGREAKPSLKLGICGEHGGDPDSIEFFDMAGLDYVSCSPYRVPIARLAAAQATIRAPDRGWIPPGD